MSTENNSGIFSLGDIPDLSVLGDSSIEGTSPFEDGWYQGQILGTRSFTDNNGNDRTFQSGDEPSARGDSRNIKLQIVLTRKADQRQMNLSNLINYQPSDLTAETINAVVAQQEKVKSGESEWGPLFRSFMTLNRLSKLQSIAGVRQFQRTGEGGLDLTPLYGKTAYFRIVPDDRNPKYKMVKDCSAKAPKTLR